jgi:hypothetical protein
MQNDPLNELTYIPDDAMEELVTLLPDITDKERKYVYWRSIGVPPKVALERAGYASTNSGTKMDVRPSIRRSLALLHEQLEPEHRISQKKVVSILMEAIDLARIKGQPANMILGAAELAKIAGLFAPQVFEVNSNVKQLTARIDNPKALMHMSKAELESMAGVQRCLPSPPARLEQVLEAEFEDLEPVTVGRFAARGAEVE